MVIVIVSHLKVTTDQRFISTRSTSLVMLVPAANKLLRTRLGCRRSHSRVLAADRKARLSAGWCERAHHDPMMGSRGDNKISRDGRETGLRVPLTNGFFSVVAITMPSGT